VKVCLAPPPGLSRAMTRVERALARHAPPDATLVDDRAAADLAVLHVIGAEGVRPIVDELRRTGRRYAVIQYCLRTTSEPRTGWWRDIWADAAAVWSYYDLRAALRADGVTEPDGWTFYDAPLGLDRAFARAVSLPEPPTRPIGIMTSGYVAAGQEAIFECAVAAERVGLTTLHIGPPTVVGMARKPTGWTAAHDVDDATLARAYGSARFVSGLRYGEGFELPAAEGLACGARPIMFDRPDARRWFDGLAAFVPVSDGAPLTAAIAEVLCGHGPPVSAAERALAADRFNWTRIAAGFWAAIARRSVLT
jgi:hypothetical protein